MLAAVAKRAKRTLFDDPYRTLVSNSNKCNHNNIKKPTVFASLHSKLWMTMSSNARPLGGRVTMFLSLFSLLNLFVLFDLLDLLNGIKQSGLWPPRALNLLDFLEFS